MDQPQECPTDNEIYEVILSMAPAEVHGMGLRNWLDPEDLANECYLRLQANNGWGIESIRSGRWINWRGAVCMTVRNLAVDEYRRMKKTPRPFSVAFEDDGEVDFIGRGLKNKNHNFLELWQFIANKIREFSRGNQRRLQSLSLWIKGTPVKKICAQVQVHENSVRKWIGQFREYVSRFIT